MSIFALQVNKEDVVTFVDDLLIKSIQEGTFLSITITKLGILGDCYALTVTETFFPE